MTKGQESRIFITAADAETARKLREGFRSRGFDTGLLESVDELGNIILTNEFDLIILTGDIQDKMIKRLLRKFRKTSYRGAVIALWEGGPIEEEEKIRMMGIDRVLRKPPDVKEVFLIAKLLLEREEMSAQTGIIGKSEIIQELLEKLVRFAPVNSTVLILGESGTGKELVARALHRFSSRRHRAFIAVNCAALPEGVLESELFGHERGAFTGASSLRKGRFEIAHGGTLFLDEIGEMSPSTQVHLLRVLEEKEIMRVGGSATIPVDVRVVTATNRDLREEVEAGRFRRDLYYRLKVLTIEVPPLRERRADIPLLVNKFISDFCEQNRQTFAGFTDEALEVLKNYDWPGNVRELRNLIESMLVLSPDGKIQATDIPEHIYRKGDPKRLLPIPVLPEIPRGREFEAVLQALFEIKRDLEELKLSITLLGSREVFPPEGHTEFRETGNHDGYIKIAPGASLEDVEKKLVAATLELVDGNRRMASELLGIGERTLYRKIKEYGLS